MNMEKRPNSSPEVTSFNKVEIIIANENNEEIKEVSSGSSNQAAAINDTQNDEFSAVK